MTIPALRSLPAAPVSAGDGRSPTDSAEIVGGFGSSFASLLDPQSSQQAPERDRTFTFADLGMFGRHAPQAFDTSEERDERAGTTVASASLEGASPDLSDAVGTRVGDANAFEISGSPAGSAVESAVVQAAPVNTRGQTIMASTSSISSLTEPRSGETTEFADRLLDKRSAPDLPPARPSDAPSLTVSGSDDALSIVVRVPSGGVGDQLHTQRLIEDTVAEFGMGIAELRLNGAVGERTNRSTMGGSHGRRAG